MRSPTVRAFAIGFLILILQIPVALVHGLVGERQERQREATAEIGEKWGGAQTIVGPFFEVPYRLGYTTVDDDGNVTSHEATHIRRFLPTTLEIRGAIDVERRMRGIFVVPVYRSRIDVSGDLEVPDLGDFVADPSDILWDQSRLVVEIGDASGVRSASPLAWDEREVELEPAESVVGISAPVELTGAGAHHAFSFGLDPGGTERLLVVPAGGNTTVSLRSAWPHPSFQGGWLPETREVGTDGFTATWRVSALARGFPSAWSDEQHRATLDRLRHSALGVELMSSVDHYVMSARSTRYAVLFLLAVFAVVWLLEQRARLRLHPLQYLLLGAALCCFHLLILAFSEHVGFEVAYAGAAVMVTALVSFYARAALASALRSAVVGLTCLSVYGYLYVCLRNEDYALLIGSLGVFFGLAVVMALTRELDWRAKSSD